MGSITRRKTKDNKIRFRAVVRVDRQGYPAFNESKTFSRKALAETWIKKREAEIESNPDILLNRSTKSMLFRDVINKYLDDLGSQFGRTHRLSLKLIARTPIASKQISELRREDYTAFADSRLSGKYEGLKSIQPTTLKGDMISIRSVLKQAKLAWGLDVDLSEFEDAMLGLKHSRKVAPSNKRFRTSSSEELQALTTHFYSRYINGKSKYPMHLVVWFAIYSARRQAEITRLKLSDYNDGWWLVRDVKSPTGSKGNHINSRITDRAKTVIEQLQKDEVRNKMRLMKYWNDDLLLPVSNRSISTNFIEACKFLGIEDLRFHDLRHEAATRLAEQGMTIPEMQQITAHESWSSLQRYVNITPRKTVLEFDEAIEVAKSALQESHR